MYKNAQILFQNIYTSQEQFIQKETNIPLKSIGDMIATKTTLGQQNSNHKIDPFEQITSILSYHPKKELDSNICFKDFTQNKNNKANEIDKKATNLDNMSKRKRKSSSLLLFRNNTLNYMQSFKNLAINDETIYGKNLEFKQFLNILLAVFSLISVISAILDNEYYINKTRIYLKNKYNISLTDLTKEQFEILHYHSSYLENRKISTIENIFRYINMISSLMCCYILFRKYKIQLYLFKLDKKISEYDNLFSTGKWKNLLLESIICLICVPPYINKIYCFSQLTIRYFYSLNSLMFPFTLVKLYNIGRLYFILSKYNTKLSKTICQTHNISSGLFFTIKLEIISSPIKIGCICLFLFILFNSFLTRQLENLAFDTEKGLEGNKGTNDLQNLMNNIWLVIITITGVSYGDKYPRTNFGRIIIFIVCFIGMFFIGFTIAIISENISFNENEKKAFSKLKKIFSVENIEHKAGNVIKDILLMRRNIKKTRFDLTKIYDKHELFCEKIIICMKIKSDAKNFKNKLQVSRSYSIPINDAIFHMEHKLYENLIIFSNHLDKISIIENDFNILEKQQNLITQSIKRVNFLQGKILNYLVERQNSNYLNEIQLKEEKKSSKLNSSKLNSSSVLRYCKKYSSSIKFNKTFHSEKFTEVLPKNKTEIKLINKTNNQTTFQNKFLSPPKVNKPKRNLMFHFNLQDKKLMQFYFRKYCLQLLKGLDTNYIIDDIKYKKKRNHSTEFLQKIKINIIKHSKSLKSRFENKYKKNRKINGKTIIYFPHLKKKKEF